jgi:hypothetical protein
MNVDGFLRALHAFNRRRPFQAFLIEFVSGDRLRVSHPEAVNQYDEFFYYRGPDRSQRVFDAAEVCQFIAPAPT